MNALAAMLCRLPRPALRPFVALVWASRRRVPAHLERVLPTGGMHLVFRGGDDPLTLHDGATRRATRTLRHAVVGGARAEPYVRSVAGREQSVGAMLRPGAARLLLGAPAGSLAGTHTPLEDLWGRRARSARDRIFETPALEDQLHAFETTLSEQLPQVRGLHPAVAFALGSLTPETNVREVVAATGYSHRRMIGLFREAVGLTPKVHCRLLRLQRVLARLPKEPRTSLAAVALEEGYSDQSHLSREFRALTGLSPARYRRLAPTQAHHVPLDP